jgi:hypothetical protein
MEFLIKYGAPEFPFPFFVGYVLFSLCKLFMHNIYEEKDDYQLTFQKFESEFT